MGFPSEMVAAEAGDGLVGSVVTTEAHIIALFVALPCSAFSGKQANHKNASITIARIIQPYLIGRILPVLLFTPQ
jgi:hypothetical protein